MEKPNGVYIPADKVRIVLDALHFYRQIIGYGAEAERRSRNTDLYGEVCRTVDYIADKSPC